MTIEQALMVTVPSVSAVVWLLTVVYGIRGDLREIQATLKAERRAVDERMTRLEAMIESLAGSVSDLTLDLARVGLRALKEQRNASESR
jgi:hypothetical protein